VTTVALNILNSPFSEQQLKQINELYPTLTPYQKIWLTGFLSAEQLGAAIPSTTEVTEAIQVTKTATILFASQTGNSQHVAQKLANQLKDNGVEVTLESTGKFKTKELKKIDHLLIVASTHGEGEPPDQAIQFHEFLYGKRAPKLDGLKFGVLALGDSSYEFFCKTGADFDSQLEALGATRIVPRVDCDVDYEDDATKWIQSVVEFFEQTSASDTALKAKSTYEATTNNEASNFSRKNPFYAEVLENITLNGRGSNKQTQHLELSLEGSGISFEPGDSLGIIPENNEQLVALLIEALAFDAGQLVTVDGASITLQEALQKHLEITVLSKPLLQKLQAFTTNEQLAALTADGGEWKTYAYGRDLIDVVNEFGPFNWGAQQFVDQLRKIPARLYSIASSQLAREDEVHLTIGKVSYEVDGRTRLGVASTQVADRIEIGDKLAVYVHKNPNFKLPENDETPIIMIGAGTGIAPFRSFVEERAERGAKGKSWLFFGEQHFVTDFYYQVEWQSWLADGSLTNLTLAFSRDQQEKIYVQHRLKQHAAEIFEWLEQGAALYVCGDEKSMASDVDRAIKEIVAEQSNTSFEEATAYVEQLKQQQRYNRDVY
jgi:sulfite reductase (NADPH) flavoprotein alpha-component